MYSGEAEKAIEKQIALPKFVAKLGEQNLIRKDVTIL